MYLFLYGRRILLPFMSPFLSVVRFTANRVVLTNAAIPRTTCFVAIPRACSPDIHACLAKVAEIRWRRCVPESRLGIARLRETIMLQMMYLRMTDTKSAAREGERVWTVFPVIFVRTLFVQVAQTHAKNILARGVARVLLWRITTEALNVSF